MIKERRSKNRQEERERERFKKRRSVREHDRHNGIWMKRNKKKMKNSSCEERQWGRKRKRLCVIFKKNEEMTKRKRNKEETFRTKKKWQTEEGGREVCPLCLGNIWKIIRTRFSIFPVDTHNMIVWRTQWFYLFINIFWILNLYIFIVGFLSGLFHYCFLSWQYYWTLNISNVNIFNIHPWLVYSLSYFWFFNHDFNTLQMLVEWSSDNEVAFYEAWTRTSYPSKLSFYEQWPNQCCDRCSRLHVVEIYFYLIATLSLNVHTPSFFSFSYSGIWFDQKNVWIHICSPQWKVNCRVNWSLQP